MFAIVKQEEQPPSAQLVGERVERRHSGAIGNACRRQHGAGDVIGLLDRCEVDEPHTISETRRHVACGALGEAGLADSSRADDGDQPMGGDQVHDPFDVRGAADQAGQLRRQVAGAARIARFSDRLLLSRRREERRIVGQDRVLESLEGRARFDAQFLDQHRTGHAVDLEGLGLAARPVEGEHQLTAEPLAERMRGDQLLKLADQSGVPS